MARFSSGINKKQLDDAIASVSVTSSHIEDTVNVHGIADTSLLETQSGAQSKANAAQTAAQSYADSLAINYDPAGTAATAVAQLIDAAPETLNTLNELASALGEDPNFATTISNQLGLKANSADLSVVATTGAYSDLTGRPNIPANANRVAVLDGTGGLDGYPGFSFESGLLSVGNLSTVGIDIGTIQGDFNAIPAGISQPVYFESFVRDRQEDASGITIRASQNPLFVDSSTDISALNRSTSDTPGDVGAIFSVRSFGGRNSLWVGQGITSTGSNDFYVGDTSGTNDPWVGSKAVIIASSGEARFDGEVYAFYSDERLKNFEGKIDNALDKVSQLNGYYFTENQVAKDLGYNNDQRQVGVSAQEVEAVLPEVVAPAPVNPEYKTVKYEKMVPLLIEAIKELKTENEKLSERIAQLENT